MQLRKNPPFEIDPKDPFKSDELERKPAIELLTRLVKSTDQPFVISVEAPWGWGKTKFIEMWKAHLEISGHVCLHFNAWENDFVSDPLVAFIGEMRVLAEVANTGGSAPIRKHWEGLLKIGGTLARKSAPILIKAAASKALGSEAVKEVATAVAESSNEIAEALSKAAEKQIENYESEKNSIRKFRETLRKLAEKVTEGESKPKQIVFFVDELDRCRPDFAMTLLERVKHLFNVERVVFVLSLDREQLRNTVNYLYGSGQHADSYLRRFIDIAYRLPKPNPQSFSNMLQQRFQMAELFRTRSQGSIEFDRFRTAFIEVAYWLELDLRTQEQCFTRINVIARLWNPNDFLPTDALCVLVGLKIGKPKEYEEFRAGKIVPKDWIPKKLIQLKEFPVLVEATLLAVFLSDMELNHELLVLGKECSGQRAEVRPNAHEVLKKTDHLRIHRPMLKRMIEFSTSF
jgi:hypothetical protein